MSANLRKHISAVSTILSSGMAGFSLAMPNMGDFALLWVGLTGVNLWTLMHWARLDALEALRDELKEDDDD